MICCCFLEAGNPLGLFSQIAGLAGSGVLAQECHFLYLILYLALSLSVQALAPTLNVLVLIFLFELYILFFFLLCLVFSIVGLHA